MPSPARKNDPDSRVPPDREPPPDRNRSGRAQDLPNHGQRDESDETSRSRCPCFVRLRYIKVAGDSTSSILNCLAALFIENPFDRDLYHSALEVQIEEDDECSLYIIEMQDYIREHALQLEVGQIKYGFFARGILGTLVAALVGPAYGIRKWRNGRIVDADRLDLAHPNPQVLSTSCTDARRVLDLVSQVPSHRYGADWTSNSVISWILEKASLNPAGTSPPVHGVVPGWREGVVAAGGQ